MKLLFGIKGMDGAWGGAERVLAQVCSSLVKRGHDVVLVTFDPPDGQSAYSLDPRIRRISLGVGRANVGTTLGEALRRIPALRRVAIDEAPDVAVGFMHSMFVLMAFGLIGTGIPVVASEHIVPAYYRKRKPEFVLLLLSWLLARRVTLPSDSARMSYPRIFSHKMITIPNPIDPARERSNPEARERADKVILNVGRLDPQKDQKTLVDAFAAIADLHENWRLRIVGAGQLHDVLADRATALNVADKVELVGTTDNIEAEYANAQIFVMPSLYEAFGVATGEAMAHGLPVVGFADCPGTNELVEHGVSGILVDRGNRVDQLAAALEHLIVSPELRAEYGRKGPDIIRRYAREVVVDEWETLLNTVAAAGS